MKIGDKVFIRANINEIRRDVVICENAGGYFGTVEEEIYECADDGEMSAEEYRQKMIETFHNTDCDNLIALVVQPDEKEFEHLEWLLKTHYKKPKRGHWIPKEDNVSDWYECDNCGERSVHYTRFCPKCGYRMMDDSDNGGE